MIKKKKYKRFDNHKKNAYFIPDFTRVCVTEEIVDVPIDEEITPAYMDDYETEIKPIFIVIKNMKFVNKKNIVNGIMQYIFMNELKSYHLSYRNKRIKREQYKKLKKEIMKEI